MLQLSPVRKRNPSPLTIIIPVEKKTNFLKYLYFKIKKKKKKYIKLHRNKSRVLTDIVNTKQSVIQI